VVGSLRPGDQQDVRFFGPRQPIEQHFQTVGERVQIEILGVVMAAADIAVDHGVEGGNEPLPRTNAGQRIDEGEPVVLCRGETRRRRHDVVSAVPRPAAAGLDELDVQKQPLERNTEIQGALELGGAPRHAEIVADEQVAAA
jgi:hypothetical protein